MPVNGTLPGDRGQVFFAEGSDPAGEDDESVLAAAEKKVWPVVLTWTHFAASGEVHDSVGWLSCVKAPERAEESGAGLVLGVDRWMALGVGFAVSMVLVGL